MEKLKTNRNAGLYIELTTAIHVFTAVIAVVSSLLGHTITISLILGVFDWNDILYLFLYCLNRVLALAWLVYSTVLLWGVCRDMNVICRKCNIVGDNLNYIFMRLLSAISFGIYSVFWSNQKGKNMEEAAKKYHVKIREKSDFHLIAAVLGVVFLWLYGLFSGVISRGVLSHPFFILICALFNLAFGLTDMVNMACFIQEVNVLSEKYNMQEDTAFGYLEQKTPRLGGRIECCGGIYAGAQFPFDQELVIGRDGAYAHIVIDDPNVSRRHCVIRYSPENGGYLVTDESANGVFYKSGQAFPKRVPVACGRGTVFVIGKSGNEFILK